jgi:hypothetical protein
VLVLDLLQLAHLIEARLQSIEEQFIFGLGVRDQRRLEQASHDLDFAERSGGGDGMFEMVQLGVDDRVFGDEGIRDFHAM